MSGSSFIGGDFFVAVPTADLLLVKHVLHDWPDDACIKILRNCRNALLPGGRIVVVEMLVDETHPSRFIAQFDLTMLTVVGGKERTLEEYRRLFNLAGLRFERATATATAAFVLEIAVA